MSDAPWIEGITVVEEADVEERGDLLIADRFVTECGEDFRYTPGIGWLRWTGSVWEVCDLGEQLEAIKGVARRMIAAGADTHERTAWAAMQLPRVKGALGFAEVDPTIAVPAIPRRRPVPAGDAGRHGGVAHGGAATGAP